jgi:hypothetical protein
MESVNRSPGGCKYITAYEANPDIFILIRRLYAPPNTAEFSAVFLFCIAGGICHSMGESFIKWVEPSEKLMMETRSAHRAEGAGR